jgi:hypothetical protein
MTTNSPEAAAFLEDLIDACVMESYFREPMAERDLLFHDTVAPHLAAYADSPDLLAIIKQEGRV